MSAQPSRAGERRAAYELIRVLAESETSADAARRALAWIAGATGARVVALWFVDEHGDLLRLSEDWGEQDPALDELRRVSRRVTFARGVGLPGRVWETAEPAWIDDLGEDVNFPRVQAALAAGMRSAAALPVIARGGVLGVAELFAPVPLPSRPVDALQLRSIGRQLGEYFARVQAEERLRISEEVSATIIHAALDCIITMDHEGCVVDFNPAAERTFGYTADDARDRKLADLIIPPELRKAHHQALSRYMRTRQARILDQRLELTGMRADGTMFPVELTVTRVGRQEPPLFAGFIRDITDRRRAEEETGRLLASEHDARVRAEEAEVSARRIAETLQRSLLPPHLPDIPGIELGAAYRPGAEGFLVGGDFYDVFDLGAGRWGIAIGDVCGKGPDAAAVTGLLRYAIRTAAVRESTPSAVLRVANDALLGASEDGEFCTAIYAYVETTDGEPSLALAVAGHPLPYRLSPAGAVAPVGTTGTLLGAVSDPVFEDVRLELADGDLILLYTDGVIETRTPSGLFGAERLERLLASAAGLHPADVVSRIEAAAADDARHRTTDDVAMLALRIRAASAGG